MIKASDHLSLTITIRLLLSDVYSNALGIDAQIAGQCNQSEERNSDCDQYMLDNQS